MMKSVKSFLGAFLSLAAILFVTSAYADSAEVETRIDALLDKMTVEEKVGQMTQVTLAVLLDEATRRDRTKLIVDPDKLKDAINKYHVGSILNTGSRALTIEEWRRLITMIQDEALASRISVPVIYGIDSIHGATYMKGSTLFPHNIGLAASRNVELAGRVADVTAKETRAAGIRWNFDPVLDVGRNPLWSRFEETFGEDSYLAGEMGTAMVRSYEKGDPSRPDAVASCMKHYLGYSDPANGKDRTPAYIPDIELYEHHVPPFRKAIEAGAATIMINSASINGMPVHGSKRLLTELLRDELGFKGLVVSDWEDVIRLHVRHKIAETPRDAVRIAVEAGLDMSMVPNNYSFFEHLVSLVNDGEISESRIDESVRRILRLKFDVGLFDNAYAEEGTEALFGLPAYRELALQAAQDSMTLLENNGVLPLEKGTKVLVAGPAAHNIGALHSSWSYTWQGRDERAYPEDTLSLVEALSLIAGDGQVTSMGSAKYDDPANVDPAMLGKLAADADVILLALGEHAYAESPGGIDDLTLEPDQQALARAAVASGKPVIVVLIEGRPRVLGDWVDEVAAVLQAYRPGSRGAEAIGNVLFGNYNPSGVLPYTYPAATGDIMPYDRRVLANFQRLGAGAKISEGGYKPRWPFGHGLSYTTFEVSNLQLDKEVMGPGDTLTVSVTVANTGDREGTRVVDLFVKDLYASVTPSFWRLREFSRVDLGPGETTTIEFTLTADDLAIVNESNKRVTEDGDFEIHTGGEVAAFRFQAGH